MTAQKVQGEQGKGGVPLKLLHLQSARRVKKKKKKEKLRARKAGNCARCYCFKYLALISPGDISSLSEDVKVRTEVKEKSNTLITARMTFRFLMLRFCEFSLTD